MATLTHQAFLYGSREEFVATMVPFVREGLEHGDTVFAATKRSNLDALRGELGTEAAAVEFRDAEDWYRNPHATLDAYRRYLDGHRNGNAVRVIGEPVWPSSHAAIREWARYESVINKVLADSHARIVCPYNTAALPSNILDHAVRSHPELVVDGAAEPSAGFLAPEEFPLALELPDPLEGGVAFEIEDGKMLSAFRRVVAAHALEAGFSSERIQDFVLATCEIATNSLRHGHPPVRAYLGIRGDEFVCQLVDSGAGMSDPLVGWAMPELGSAGGYGLALARRLCDGVEIIRQGPETLVSLHVSLTG